MPENNPLRPKVGVGVLVWREQQLLLGQRITKGRHSCWQFPGGHLENNESVSDCARREVLEETGLSIKDLRHLGFTDKPFEIAQQKYITLLVSCEYKSGEAERLEPEKCAGWQWFDYQKLPASLFEPITLFLSQISNSSGNDLYALHCASQLLLDASTPAS
jgi:8-oxo-dGTP diphosphatase